MAGVNSYDLGVDIELADAVQGCASSVPGWWPCARVSSPAVASPSARAASGTERVPVLASSRRCNADTG